MYCNRGLAAVQTDVLPAVDIRAAVTKRALLRAGGAGGKAAAATSALFQAYGLDGSVEAWVHSARGPDHPSAPTSGVLPGQTELAAVKDHAGDTTGRDDAEVPVEILLYCIPLLPDLWRSAVSTRRRPPKDNPATEECLIVAVCK